MPAYSAPGLYAYIKNGSLSLTAAVPHESIQRQAYFSCAVYFPS